MVQKLIFVLIISYIIWEILEHIAFPVYWLIRNRKKNLLCGEPGMIGQEVVVKKWNESRGQVLAHGELWKAVSREPFSAGDTAIVQSIEGLTLTIAREQAQPAQAPRLGRDQEAAPA